MKKNFFKKLAVALALTTAVTSVNVPAAKAAAAPSFKSSAVTLKVNEAKWYGTANSAAYSTRFVIGNKTVARIAANTKLKKVKVRGLKEGKTTLRADFKNYKTKKLVQARISVTVAADELTVKGAAQNEASKLTLTFSKDASAVKAESLSIVRDADNVVVPIKKTTVDAADKTKIVIETFSAMTDGKTYTVTFKNEKNQESKVSFVATDGKVALLEVTPATVPFGEETEISVNLKDANGVIVKNVPYGAGTDNKLEFDVTTTQGYMTGSKLVLLEKGNTAKATAKYHSYEYDTTTGLEKDVITAEMTITAVDPTAVSIAGTKYTVDTKAPDFDKLTESKTQVAVGDSAYSLYYQIKNSKNEDKTADYTTISSSDENVLLASFTATGEVKLVPVKAGVAYILVKDSKDNVVASFAVTVVAERKATTMVLDPVSVTLSNGLNDSKDVNVTLKDQYGIDLAKETPTVTNKSKPASATEPTVTPVSGKVTFATVSGTTTKGTYVYEIKIGSVLRMITITVVQPDQNANPTYKLSPSANKIDTTIEKDYDGAAKNITISVDKLRGGIKVTPDATVTNVVLKNSKGEATTASAIVFSGSTITVPVLGVNGTTVEKYLSAGSYTVEVKFTDGKGNPVTATTGFVVEDKQSGVTFEIKKNTSSAATILDAVKDKNVVEFKYENKTIESSDIVSATPGVVSGNANGNVKVKINVPVGKYVVPVEITLNQVITINK